MKSGISLMVLAITIVVLVILTGIIVVNTSYVFTDVSLNELITDISRLEALMNTYKIRKNGHISFETVDFDTTVLNSEELKQFEGETIVDGKVELYIIDLYEIDADSTNYGNSKLGATDRYLYSKTTGKVYYEQGLEQDGLKYYYIIDGER